MHFTQPRWVSLERRHTKVWAALGLGLLVVWLMAGCRAPYSPRVPQEEAVIPDTTPTRILVATFTPTLPPTLTPTSAPTFTSTPAPTFTSTPAPSPFPSLSFTPTVVLAPTLIPIAVLPPTSEGPIANADSEPVPTVEGSEQENGQAEVAQPSAATAPRRTFVGEYHNLAENREGQVRLEVQGNAVYASLQTVRSPVQYFAREQPAVLFTVPEGFRPATTIAWEVNGQHVGTTGRTNPIRRDIQVFRLSVDTEGHVRYVNDSGVDGVGYLRYNTTLAWPLADTHPQVCDRSPAIQTAILAAMSREETCAGITWTDLAGIHKLEVNAFEMGQVTLFGSFEHDPFLSYDLAGLSGLQKLHVYHHLVRYDSDIPAQLPAKFLAHVPLLQDLTFRYVKLTQLPEDWLTHTPLLRSLHLRMAADVNHLPVGFLSFTPQLQFLHLDLKNAATPFTPLPVDFLAHAPLLHVLRLYLDGESLSHLPADFLADASQLEILTLEVNGDGALSLPSHFLAHTPRLKQARIWIVPVYGAESSPVLVLDETAPFLAHVPQLRQLWLQRVDVGPHFVSGLPLATEVHWVPRDSGSFPTTENLSLAPSRHWLHLGGGDRFPAQDYYYGLPLNLVLVIGGSIRGMLADWLSHQLVSTLTVAMHRNSPGLQTLLNFLPGDQLSRLTVLPFRTLTLPPTWGQGRSFDWLYLSKYIARAGDEEFFANFSTSALLLHPIPHFYWQSQTEADRLDLRELMQAPRTQHLGLILDVDLFLSDVGTLEEGTWILPARLLDDLDFECIELDFRMLGVEGAPIPAHSPLAVSKVEPQWLPRENTAVWRSPWAAYLWDTHWVSAWDGDYTDRVLWSQEPIWFELEHLPWAQAQDCSRSLYLRFQAGAVSLEAGILSQPGALKHLRIVYPTPHCQDCPTQ